MDKQQRKAAFAERFNAALAAGGKTELSDNELAKLLARHGVGTTSQSVSNWRNGKYFPRLDQIEGIATMLGMDAGELAFGKPRIAEPRGDWGKAPSGQLALSDGLALLGDEEQAVLEQLIRLLRPSARRAGRRRAKGERTA